MKKTDGRINFLGNKIVSTSKDQLLDSLFTQVESGKKTKIVFTPNPEQLVYAKSHSSFGKSLAKADYLLPDGMGIIIGSQIISAFGKEEPILERITGVDVVEKLLEKFTDQKVLIIGGREYSGLKFKNWKVVDAVKKSTSVAKSKSGVTKKSSKRKHVLFWHEGFLNVSQPTKEEKDVLLTVVEKLKPDVIFVALGAPYQEEWSIKNKKALESLGVKLVMVVGGAFDMLLGKVQRAPKWMQKMGLEWFYRLYKEPWRWRRQVKLLEFVKMVVQEVLR